jgi:hypothetical protein
MAEQTPAPTPKKRGMIELNDEVMREAKKSLKQKSGTQSKQPLSTTQPYQQTVTSQVLSNFRIIFFV